MARPATDTAPTNAGTTVFADRHIGPDDHDLGRVLDALGIDSLEDLADRVVPSSIADPADATGLDVLPPAATEVEALADRVSIIRAGRTVESGTLTELRHLTRTSIAVETIAPPAGLDTLPGVGPVLAQRILDWRTEHGRFSSVEELGEVSGIGDKALERLRSKVTV